MATLAVSSDVSMLDHQVEREEVPDEIRESQIVWTSGNDHAIPGLGPKSQFQ